VEVTKASELMKQYGLMKWGRTVKPGNPWCYWDHHVEAIEAKDKIIRNLEKHISELEECIKRFVEATNDY